MLKHKDPIMGRFEQLDLRKGGITSILVSEKELADLTGYLNSNSAATKNLVDIVDAMQKLEKIERPAFTGRSDWDFMVKRGRTFRINPKYKKFEPEKYRIQMEVDRLQDEINRALNKYRFWPRVIPPHERRWVVIWSPRKPGTHEVGTNALETVLNLARAGYLNRLRRCSNCEKWLYAKFRHQTFCSMKCQQKHYSQTEEFKAKRRDYMRRYYQENYKG